MSSSEKKSMGGDDEKAPPEAVDGSMKSGTIAVDSDAEEPEDEIPADGDDNNGRANAAASATGGANLKDDTQDDGRAHKRAPMSRTKRRVDQLEAAPDGGSNAGSSPTAAVGPAVKRAHRQGAPPAAASVPSPPSDQAAMPPSNLAELVVPQAVPSAGGHLLDHQAPPPAAVHHLPTVHQLPLLQPSLHGSLLGLGQQAPSLHLAGLPSAPTAQPLSWQQLLMGLQQQPSPQAVTAGASFPLVAAAAQANQMLQPQNLLMQFHQLPAATSLNPVASIIGNIVQGNGQSLQVQGQANDINAQIISLLSMAGQTGAAAHNQAAALGAFHSTAALAELIAPGLPTLNPVPSANAVNAQNLSLLLSQHQAHGIANGIGQSLAAAPAAASAAGAAAAPAAEAVAVPDAAAPLDPAAEAIINPSGFEPATHRERRWLMRMRQLWDFRQTHGHCRVPHGYPQNQKLSWWVMNVRAQYARFRRGEHSWMNPERIRVLESLGFEWSPNNGN